TRGTRAHVRGDFRFLNPLNAVSAFLHHAAHAHGHVRILLHLRNVRCAFAGERREVFFVNAELAGDLLFPDRPLVIIEEVEPAHFEWAVVRAITSAHTAVVSHDVEAIFAVNGGVDRANSL